jgi:hypothetical protein
MKTVGRRFLQTVASTASLGLVDVSWLRGLAYFARQVRVIGHVRWPDLPRIARRL